MGLFSIYMKVLHYFEANLSVAQNSHKVNPQYNYYSRKGFYGHNSLWDSCNLNLEITSFFLLRKYLIGKSQFLTESKLIPAFKKTPLGSMLQLR
ncbi:uncharacterized protein VP01_1225g1 [Puccinia sorghi]|uniref:Uncharacterized protein n=1 Tax=Puccinia sorghi TaxID=27349 RepID=A0A0L6VRE0_9BASI|nr:uncharacterized protein VP01_1225g1 [Puccinia sorghi]